MTYPPLLNTTNLKTFHLNKVPFIFDKKILEYLETNTEQDRCHHHANPKYNILWIFDSCMRDISVWKWLDISWIFVSSNKICPYNSDT